MKALISSRLVIWREINFGPWLSIPLKPYEEGVQGKCLRSRWDALLKLKHNLDGQRWQVCIRTTKKSLSFSSCVGVRASLSRLRGCQSHFHWCTGASSLTEQASVGGTICRRSTRFLYFLSAEMRAEQKYCALLNPAAASPAAHGVDIWRETRAFQQHLSEQQALSSANSPIDTDGLR